MREKLSEKIEYNTARPALQISEYGRIIQDMVDYACTVEDREERSALAKTIVNAMMRTTFQQGDENEIKQKLYDHLQIISDFKLDIDSPYPKLEKEKIEAKSERIAYPSKKRYQRHFGRTLPAMIDVAVNMEDGDEKNALVRLLVIQMKRDYIIYKENTLNDDSIIAEQLSLLSGGKLHYSDEIQLGNFTPPVPGGHNNERNGRYKKHHNNNKNSRNNNNKFQNRRKA